MSKQSRQILRYSISFKRKVVREIEVEGFSIFEVRRRYGIGGSHTIQRWLKLFGKNHLLNKVVRIEMKGEKDRLKELIEENKRLKLALADATLAKQALESLIEVVNENYDTDVKKNFGQKPSKKPTQKRG